MFDRDDLFASHDPFGTFAAAIAKAPSTGIAFDPAVARNQWAGRSKSEIRDHLLSCPKGMDLRPTVMRVIHERAMLIDAFEAFRITASHVSSRLARKASQMRKSSWLAGEAMHAVNACVLQEQRRLVAQEGIQDPLLDHYASLHQVFEIPYRQLRFATTRINDLVDDQRIPIVRVFLQGIPIQDVVMQSQQSMVELTQSMKVGLMTLKLEQVDGSD